MQQQEQQNDPPKLKEMKGDKKGTSYMEYYSIANTEFTNNDADNTNKLNSFLEDPLVSSFIGMFGGEFPGYIEVPLDLDSTDDEPKNIELPDGENLKVDFNEYSMDYSHGRYYNHHIEETGEFSFSWNRDIAYKAEYRHNFIGNLAAAVNREENKTEKQKLFREALIIINKKVPHSVFNKYTGNHVLLQKFAEFGDDSTNSMFEKVLNLIFFIANRSGPFGCHHIEQHFSAEFGLILNDPNHPCNQPLKDETAKIWDEFAIADINEALDSKIRAILNILCDELDVNEMFVTNVLRTLCDEIIVFPRNEQESQIIRQISNSQIFLEGREYAKQIVDAQLFSKHDHYSHNSKLERYFVIMIMYMGTVAENLLVAEEQVPAPVPVPVPASGGSNSKNRGGSSNCYSCQSDQNQLKRAFQPFYVEEASIPNSIGDINKMAELKESMEEHIEQKQEAELASRSIEKAVEENLMAAPGMIAVKQEAPKAVIEHENKIKNEQLQRTTVVEHVEPEKNNGANIEINVHKPNENSLVDKNVLSIKVEPNVANNNKSSIMDGLKEASSTVANTTGVPLFPQASISGDNSVNPAIESLNLNISEKVDDIRDAKSHVTNITTVENITEKDHYEPILELNDNKIKEFEDRILDAWLNGKVSPETFNTFLDTRMNTDNYDVCVAEAVRKVLSRPDVKHLYTLFNRVEDPTLILTELHQVTIPFHGIFPTVEAELAQQEIHFDKNRRIALSRGEVEYLGIINANIKQGVKTAANSELLENMDPALLEISTGTWVDRNFDLHNFPFGAEYTYLYEELVEESGGIGMTSPFLFNIMYNKSAIVRDIINKVFTDSVVKIYTQFNMLLEPQKVVSVEKLGNALEQIPIPHLLKLSAVELGEFLLKMYAIYVCANAERAVGGVCKKYAENAKRDYSSAVYGVVEGIDTPDKFLKEIHLIIVTPEVMTEQQEITYIAGSLNQITRAALIAAHMVYFSLIVCPDKLGETNKELITKDIRASGKTYNLYLGQEPAYTHLFYGVYSNISFLPDPVPDDISASLLSNTYIGEVKEELEKLNDFVHVCEEHIVPYFSKIGESMVIHNSIGFARNMGLVASKWIFENFCISFIPQIKELCGESLIRTSIFQFVSEHCNINYAANDLKEIFCTNARSSDSAKKRGKILERCLEAAPRYQFLQYQPNCAISKIYEASAIIYIENQLQIPQEDRPIIMTLGGPKKRNLGELANYLKGLLQNADRTELQRHIWHESTELCMCGIDYFLFGGLTMWNLSANDSFANKLFGMFSTIREYEVKIRMDHQCKKIPDIVTESLAGSDLAESFLLLKTFTENIYTLLTTERRNFFVSPLLFGFVSNDGMMRDGVGDNIALEYSNGCVFNNLMLHTKTIREHIELYDVGMKDDRDISKILYCVCGISLNSSIGDFLCHFMIEQTYLKMLRSSVASQGQEIPRNLLAHPCRWIFSTLFLAEIVSNIEEKITFIASGETDTPADPTLNFKDDDAMKKRFNPHGSPDKNPLFEQFDYSNDEIANLFKHNVQECLHDLIKTNDYKSSAEDSDTKMIFIYLNEVRKNIYEQYSEFFESNISDQTVAHFGKAVENMGETILNDALSIADDVSFAYPPNSIHRELADFLEGSIYSSNIRPVTDIVSGIKDDTKYLTGDIANETKYKTLTRCAIYIASCLNAAFHVKNSLCWLWKEPLLKENLKYIDKNKKQLQNTLLHKIFSAVLHIGVPIFPKTCVWYPIDHTGMMSNNGPYTSFLFDKYVPPTLKEPLFLLSRREYEPKEIEYFDMSSNAIYMYSMHKEGIREITEYLDLARILENISSNEDEENYDWMEDRVIGSSAIKEYVMQEIQRVDMLIQYMTATQKIEYCTMDEQLFNHNRSDLSQNHEHFKETELIGNVGINAALQLKDNSTVTILLQNESENSAVDKNFDLFLNNSPSLILDKKMENLNVLWEFIEKIGLAPPRAI